MLKLDDKLIHEIQKARGGHVIFAPSGSAMWANCAGSLLPNLLVEDSAGEDAAEGSVGHEIAEQWLKAGRRPTHRVGEIVEIRERYEAFNIEITWEMLDYVQEYVDWVSMLPGEHFVETRVDFSDLTPIPHQSGTADHAACDREHLIVSDLKFGKGIMVFAEENTQLLLYAYGFFKLKDPEYHFKKITLRIGQPRLNHYDEWSISREELLARAKWLKERAYAAWSKNAPRMPSLKACQWCNIKSGCAALAVLVKKILDGDVSVLYVEIDAESMEEIMSEIDRPGAFEAIEIDQLTLRQKAQIYQAKKLVDSFFREIHLDLEDRLNRGETVDGFKLVPGRSTREFRDEHQTVEHFDFLGVDAKDLYETKLLSPAKSEDLLRKVGYSRKVIPILLESVVKKTQGRPTMAVATDKRQALQSADHGVFDDDEL